MNSRPEVSHFNLRVYGLFINEQQEVLVADEFRFNRLMTKFPGGGLELGEGLLEGLLRECKEELGKEPIILNHFYTTDFFQPTQLLDQPSQLISVYYQIRFPDPEKIPLLQKPFDIEQTEGAIGFRWVSLLESPETVTFPIDRHVWTLLQKLLEKSV